MFRITIMIVLLVSSPATLIAQLQQSQIQQAKRATALVERPFEDGFGSSFCISKKGYFITNEHVIAGDFDNVALIINPGTSDEQKLMSTVIRKDETRDLALLRIDNPPSDLESLELGDGTELFETQQVAVFGYPFGTALALKSQTYPSISVNVGRITSLRKSDGELKRIQIDAVVNPGNSGGPLLTEDGKIVGVITEKVTGTEVNLCIPVSEIKAFLERPQLVLASSSISFAKRHEPFPLKFEVIEYGNAERHYRLELQWDNELGRADTLELQPAADGGFVAEIIPDASHGTLLKFPVTVDFESGSIEAEIFEQEITVGTAHWPVSELRSISRTNENEWTVTRYDDTSETASDFAFESAEVWLGAYKLDLDFHEAQKITFGVPDGRFPTRIRYEAKLFDSEELVDSAKGSVPLVGAPGSTKPARKVAADTEHRGADIAERDTYTLPDDQPAFEEVTLLYQFENEFDSYTMAGADRYAVFKFKETRTVEIFDLIQGKVVHTIRDVDSDAIISGGSRHLFITLPSQMLIQRYSLDGFQREKLSRLPLKHAPQQVHMGANADNHLFVYDGTEMHLFDAERLKPIPLKDGPLYKTRLPGSRQINVSADGLTLGSIPKGYGPVSYDALFIGEKFFYQTAMSSTSNAIRWARPSPHGRLFFLPSGKVFSELGKEVTPQWLEGTQLFPTVDPRYFISVNFVENEKRKWSTLVRVCTASDLRVIHSLNELNELSPEGNTNSTSHTIMRLNWGTTQVHYVPWAKLIFDAGYDNKTLYVRKYDVEKELNATGEDYLYVDSLPPFTAFLNNTLEYQISCKTNAESVHYQLSEGPDGMEVTSTGLMTWRPPRGMPVGIVPVVVTITSNNGDENLHTFELVVLPDTDKRR